MGKGKRRVTKKKEGRRGRLCLHVSASVSLLAKAGCTDPWPASFQNKEKRVEGNKTGTNRVQRMDKHTQCSAHSAQKIIPSLDSEIIPT